MKATPRTAKRRRTGNATIQALLTMPLPDIHKLPAELQKQALALRAAHALTSPDHKPTPQKHLQLPPQAPQPQPSKPRVSNAQLQSNKTIINAKTSNSMAVDSDSEDLSDSELAGTSQFNDNDDDKDEEESHILRSAPIRRDRSTSISLNPRTVPKTFNAPSAPVAPNYQPSSMANAPHPFGNPVPATPLRPFAFTPNSQHHRINQIPLHTSAEPPPPPFPTWTDDTSPSALHLLREDTPDVHLKASANLCCCRCSGCSCRCVKWLFFLAIIFGPLLGAIPLSARHGRDFCDSDSSGHIIRAQNRFDCVECPANAKYCLNGIAECEDRTFVVDVASNECVKRDWVGDVFASYQSAGKKAVKVGWRVWAYVKGYYESEVSKWRSVKRIRGMSFEAICVEYELEAMVVFIVSAWYAPRWRVVMIALWARVVLPTVMVRGGAERDPMLVLYLRLLSYYAPMMVSYQVWNSFKAMLK